MDTSLFAVKATPKRMSSAQRTRYAAAMDSLRQAAERSFYDRIAQRFADERQAVVPVLAERGEGALEAVMLEQSTQWQAMLQREYVALIMMFGRAEFDAVTEFVMAQRRKVSKAGGILFPSDDFFGRTVQGWTMENAGNKAVAITDTTKGLIREAMLEGQENHEGAAKISKRLDALYETFVDNGEIDYPRAMRIARTETAAAANYGHHAGAALAGEKLGCTMYKDWISSGYDGRTRESHLRMDAHGLVKLDEPFPNGLMYPGDPGGPAAEVVNCRCVEAHAVDPADFGIDADISLAPIEPPTEPIQKPKIPKKPKPKPINQSPGQQIVPPKKPMPKPKPKPPVPVPPPVAPVTPPVEPVAVPVAPAPVTPITPPPAPTTPRRPRRPAPVEPPAPVGVTRPFNVNDYPVDPKLPPIEETITELTRMRAALAENDETASATKARIAKELATRLQGDTVFMEFAKDTWYFPRPSYGVTSDFEICERACSELVRTWAAAAYDSLDMAQALQTAIRKEFNITEAWMRSHTREAREIERKYGVALQRFIRAEYENTQAWFAERGITHVNVYRGVYFELNTEIPPGYAMTGTPEIANLTLQPGNSTAATVGTALNFSGITSTSSSGALFGGRVPVQRILGTCQSGVGCKFEDEYVLLGGKMTMAMIGNKRGDALNVSSTELLRMLVSAGAKAMVKSDLPYFYLDAKDINADWTKWTWDLPPYKSPEFMQLIRGPKNLPWFRQRPVYQFAVQRGVIVDDEWVGAIQ